MMKVKFNQDYRDHKKGDTVELFDDDARTLVFQGVAHPAKGESLPETATMPAAETADLPTARKR